MNFFRGLLLEKAIRIALKARCPARIPRSGEAGAAINCYSATLRSDDEVVDVLLDGIEGNVISATAWSPSKKMYEAPCSLSVKSLDGLRLDVRHYYGLFDFKYRRPWALLQAKYSLRPQRVAAWSSLSQWLFDHKTPQRAERISAIRILKAAAVDEPVGAFDGDQSISELGLLERLHGGRIYHRPDFWKFQREAKLVLESLCESGDARRVGNGYVITGKALQTIANFEEENRRHRRQVFLTWVMIAWTAMAAVAASIQAITAVQDADLNRATTNRKAADR